MAWPQYEYFDLQDIYLHLMSIDANYNIPYHIIFIFLHSSNACDALYIPLIQIL